MLVQRVRRADGSVLVNVFNASDLAADWLVPWELAGSAGPRAVTEGGAPSPRAPRACTSRSRPTSRASWSSRPSEPRAREADMTQRNRPRAGGLRDLLVRGRLHQGAGREALDLRDRLLLDALRRLLPAVRASRGRSGGGTSCGCSGRGWCRHAPLSGLGAGLLGIAAFTSIPFAEAYALIFLSPFFVTLLSVVVLKEAVERLALGDRLRRLSRRPPRGAAGVPRARARPPRRRGRGADDRDLGDPAAPAVGPREADVDPRGDGLLRACLQRRRGARDRRRRAGVAAAAAPAVRRRVRGGRADAADAGDQLRAGEPHRADPIHPDRLGDG